MKRVTAFLLAALLVGLLPTLALAEVLVFRNDTKVAVTVNTTCTIGGKAYRNRGVDLRPGEVSQAIQRQGDMTVTISDPRNPSMVYFQGALRSGKEKLAFSIQNDPAVPGKMRVQRLLVAPGRN